MQMDGDNYSMKNICVDTTHEAKTADHNSSTARLPSFVRNLIHECGKNIIAHARQSMVAKRSILPSLGDGRSRRGILYALPYGLQE